MNLGYVYGLMRNGAYKYIHHADPGFLLCNLALPPPSRVCISKETTVLNCRSVSISTSSQTRRSGRATLTLAFNVSL